MLFGPDGYLYVGIGDNTEGFPAQQGDRLTGKMLRIDPSGDDFPADSVQNYAIPFDNPFVDSTGVRDEIWAFGFRNPFRFSFDRANGDLYVGDVGEFAREEIDYQPGDSPGGENYGWPLMEGSACRNPPVDCDDGTLTYPIYEYLHTGSCHSVIGGIVYRGSEIPWIQGHYFFGDFCQPVPNIFSFRVVADSLTEFTDRSELQPDEGAPLRWIAAVAEDGVGEMYFVEKSPAGRIHKVVADPAVAVVTEPPSSRFLELTPGAPNPFRRSTRFGVRLEQPAQLDVSVYSATGRLVHRLYRGRPRPAFVRSNGMEPRAPRGHRRGCTSCAPSRTEGWR